MSAMIKFLSLDPDSDPDLHHNLIICPLSTYQENVINIPPQIVKLFCRETDKQTHKRQQWQYTSLLEVTYVTYTYIFFAGCNNSTTFAKEAMQPLYSGFLYINKIAQKLLHSVT